MSKILVVVAVVLTFTASAYGQANITFSGGNGTPLTFTLSQSVVYTITTDSSAGSAPIFNFQNMGDLFGGDLEFNGINDTLSYSVNGGALIPINTLSDNSGNVLGFDSITPTGLPGVSTLQVLTLNAGSYTTPGDFAEVTPAGGSFTTFVENNVGTQLSTVGVAVAPEPSTWMLLLGGLGILLFSRSSRWAAQAFA